ncbi:MULTISPECIES: ester cyclase [Caballeronia]|uniref:Ester cyclase n=1 Tax=Caballeronia jiangsuensis TaxID=1458357 RepID=A0ABW9CXV1_9BURK|nr:ester cyclase [Caballeronia sp. GaOx3]
MTNAPTVTLLEPRTLVIDTTIPMTQLEAQILATRKYGTFWENGDESLAREVLSPDYRDRTLPPGRPLGIDGPLGAFRAIRAAIPDMRCVIDQLLVLGDRVMVHLEFKGHFKGTFKGVQGRGQPVAFIAMDIYRFDDGLLVESWHLEDNLTLYTQMGLICA